ncbi:MAG: hypothetical protein UHH87_08995 [Akkermansia sp.]|nr:hypothetical protein [Akkermansia sp.]
MNRQAEDKYADIINLPHHVSRNHPQMSMGDRAAQFSPFAALTGHDAAIAEAARLTDERPILDESVKQEISNLLQLAATDSNLVLNIVYFVPDARKTGGSYAEITGRIKKLLPHEKQLIMDTGTRIPVEEIVKISINATLALKVCS